MVGIPTAPSTQARNATSRFLRSLWQHKGAFSISFFLTVFALFLYAKTSIQEQLPVKDPLTPLYEFVNRMEANSLDARFQIRGHGNPDRRIVIAEIDQRSQEILGQWPFPRANFAKMLDALRKDGAKVVAFDVTFSKPEQSTRLLEELRDSLEASRQGGGRIDPTLARRFEKLREKYDGDVQFARAIRDFKRVVLGNFFLYTQADSEGIEEKTLDEYADLLLFFPFPAVEPIPGIDGKEARLRLIQEFDKQSLVARGAVANIPILTNALGGGASTGFFTSIPDTDGVIRNTILALPFGRSRDRAEWDFYGSMDVHSVKLYLDLPTEQTILTYSENGIVKISFGPSHVIRPNDTLVGRFTINYQGPVRTFSYVSIADVVQEKFPPGTFRDKIVLVGATASGIADLRSTPYGRLDYPGVEIHANVIDNILNNRFIQKSDKQFRIDLAAIFLFGIPLGIWLALVKPKWLPLGLLLLAPFAYGVQWAFEHGWWLNFTVPALFTLVPNVALVALYRVLIEEKEKRKVRGAFQQYLSPEVVRRLLENPDLVSPRKTEITVLFSDIRGFTSISEKLDAQELALLLNEYLTEMTQIVFSSRGTLDKYIGDAVMAFWGAPFEEPGHEANACRAALQMMQRLREIQQRWRDLGRPHIDIGIGLNTGVASVGNMGSELRYGYTAMGDAVNLSARLEGVNKDYGTNILLSETTYTAVQGFGFLTRELDFIRVKGKEQPIALYELLGMRDGDAQLAKLAGEFERARALYRQRAWKDARRAFEAILERWPKDGPSQIFVARCAEYELEDPGSQWDGVYVMKHK